MKPAPPVTSTVLVSDIVVLSSAAQGPNRERGEMRDRHGQRRQCREREAQRETDGRAHGSAEPRARGLTRMQEADPESDDFVRARCQQTQEDVSAGTRAGLADECRRN